MVDNKVYSNKPQRFTQLIGANNNVICAGRRTGNTDSIAPVAQYKKHDLIGNITRLLIF